MAVRIPHLPYFFLDTILFGKHSLAISAQIVLQHIIGPERESSFQLNGHEFYCYTSQKVFFERGNYEREVLRALQPYLPADAVVYDVGANIGYWVVRLADSCKWVVAFEPSPVNLAWLRRNTERLANVIVSDAAVSSYAGSIRMVEDGTQSRVGSGNLEVRTITLDGFAGPAPTLIMIDVEGHAGEVLQGAQQLLSTHMPTVIVELHDDQERGQVEKHLLGLQYGIHPIEHARSYPYHIVANANK